MLNKQDLFTARDGRYWIYRIPTILVTPRGVVLACCEARRGLGGDWDHNDLVQRRSMDGGVTWEAPARLISAERYGPGPVSNAVMVGNRDTGVVHALYCHDYARVFHMVSMDDGASYSDPVEITAIFNPLRQQYPWQVVALGPGHGTQLRSGRMIIPVWLSEGTGTEFGAGLRGHRPSCVSLIYSDDGGDTWQAAGIVLRQEDAVNPSETVCVELADGSVMFNSRSESPEHRRLVSISPDGVHAWSKARFDPVLLEPVCMAALIRQAWPQGFRPGRILFANPDTTEQTMAAWACDRKRLAVKLSYDDGQTWPVSKVLEEGPAGYSDLAVLPDGKVLCFYECGMIEHMADTAALVAARFDIEWLEQVG